LAAGWSAVGSLETIVFEKFEPAARQAFLDARAEASRAGQDEIRSEHVLLGLLAEPGPAADALAAAGLDLAALRARLPRGEYEAPGGMDADALSTLGIDLDAVRRATDAAFGPGALDRVAVPGRSRLPIADDARQTLAQALRQAKRLGQHRISSGHMLIGILDQPRNGALTVLTQAGTDIAALRADVLRRILATA
jgi:ATP-dependent Clp protease ATP-binding subunit ClpA